MLNRFSTGPSDMPSIIASQPKLTNVQPAILPNFSKSSNGNISRLQGSSVLLCFALFVILIAGCSNVNESANYLQTAAKPSSDARFAYDYDRSAEVGALGGREIATGTTEITKLESGAGKELMSSSRQIIYTANIRLVVDNFSTFPDRLKEASEKAGGFISETQMDRMRGEFRSGKWVVRVPAKSYMSFVNSISGLGFPESISEKADDVTEQFVDLQARITSGKRLEEQIIKLLEKQDDKIENVLAVERELSRVRTEIELMEGRMRVLQDQVALSTITIHASEERTYVPEQARTLGSRIEIAWKGAIDRATTFASDAVVGIVANALVIAGWIIGLLVFWILIGRRIYRRMKGAVAPNS
jgi:hypothetical protein